MTKDEIAEVFSDFDPSEYEQEARERWGETEAFKESARRTARYTTDDWKAIKRHGDEIEVGLAEALRAGLEPDAPEVQRLVRSHWSMINDRFYECPPKMYRGLGEMYASDPRFAAHYDKRAEGLAVFVRDAVVVFCDTQDDRGDCCDRTGD